MRELPVRRGEGPQGPRHPAGRRLRDGAGRVDLRADLATAGRHGHRPGGQFDQGGRNQVLPARRAIVSCRIVPDQRPDEVFEQLKAVLTKDPPWGVKVTVSRPGSVDVVDDLADRPGVRGRAGRAAEGLRPQAGDDRLRRHHRLRRPAGGPVRRRAGAAAGHRRPAEQRPRAEREPARGRLEGADALRSRICSRIWGR